MEARLYTFNKKRNSTAIPSNQVGIVVDVVLKIETSYNAPSFVLYIDSPKDYNYLQFDGAWYFITDIVAQRNNLWRLDCIIDVLATCREAIFDTSAYVVFRTGGSRNIQDFRIAPLSTSTNWSGVFDIGVNTTGHFNLAVTGQVGVSIWQLTENMLNSLLTNIQNWADNMLPVDADLVATLRNGMRQMISQGSAMDCIRSCKWLPFPNAPAVGGFVYCGNYNTAVAATRIVEPLTVKTVDFQLPFRNTGFLRLPPFCDVSLYLPFVGVVNISHPRFVDSANVHINISIDNRDGTIVYDVSVGGVHVGCYGGATAVDIPVGVSNVSPIKIAQSVGAVTAAVATGGATAIGAAAIATAMNLQPTPSSVGGIQGGAGAGLPTQISYSLIEHSPSGAIGNMDDVQGTPYYNTMRIGDISGYCQTQGFSLQGAYRLDIIDSVNSMIDAGVYIE